MKKNITYGILATLIFSMLPSILFAQTFTVEGGTAGSHLYNILYTWYQAPRSQRLATHFPAAQITLGGMSAGAAITSLDLERLAGDVQSFPAGGANVKIYLENRDASSLDLGAGTITWATVITGATLVYDGDPSGPLGNSAGWKTFSFGIGTGAASSFNYTGGAIVVYAEYVHTISTGAVAIPLRYATPAQGTPAPNGWTTNSTKYTNNSTTTPPATMASSTGNHPHMRFNFAGLPCVAPPTPGTATASAANVCPSAAVSLNLSANSAGTGQTYKWQSAAAVGGPYTDITTDAISPITTINPVVSAFYRAVVTCGGMSANSTPVGVTVNPGLAAGTYTINSAVATGGTNFQTFNAAVAAMACGILGPVVFNVDAASGPYTEQVTIPVIPNSSATNTVVFNGNGRTLQFPPVTAARHIIKLDGADYVTLDSLNIVATDATYGWGIHLINQADHNTITRCTINISANTSTTQSNSAGIVAAASTTAVTTTGNNASYTTITSNNILGAYQGIIMHGIAANRSMNNVISNNVISDFYATGLEISYHDGTIVSGNDISRASRTAVTTFTGIEVGVGSLNVNINANRIHDTHNTGATQTGTAYGVYFNACDAPAGAENEVTNNLIYNFNSGSGVQYGLYNSSSDSVRYYHNTVILDNAASTAGTTRAFYQVTAATGIDIKNNLLYVTRGGTGVKYLLYFGTATSTLSSNNNILYINSPAGTNAVGFANSTTFNTLADWILSGVYDNSSTDIAPLFVSPATGDFTPTVASLNNLGVYVGINTDIIGAARSNSTPDIGAYEFNVSGCTAPPSAGTAAATPGGIVCAGTTVNFSLTGNSIGLGQTYQWQSSATPGGTFANISAVLSDPPFGYTVTAPMYYRVAVTCSGNTQYSNEIFIDVPSLFPSGTYTINSNLPTGGSNFQTLAAAVSAIQCGVTGAVTFNVDAASGPYNEQVIIPQIVGANAANRVVFNGNGRTISFLSANTNERAGIKLNAADYVTINNFVITATGTTATEYGFGIQVLGDADGNIISNNQININTTSTSTNYSGIAIGGSAVSATASGSSTDNSVVSGNTVTGGNYGISLYGTSGSLVQNNQIINNIVRDQDEEGIYVAYTANTLVENNDISRPVRTAPTDFTGIYFVNQSLAARVSKNRIHDPYAADPADASAAYGIYFSSCDATPGNENIVSNNLIYKFNGGGIQYGIYNIGSDSVWFYHNTIALQDQAYAGTAVTRGFYQTTTARGIEFRNNIVRIGRGGSGVKHALYFAATTTASTIISNNNDLYLASAAGTNSIGHLALPTPATSYTTLANWQANTGYDAASLSLDPLFTDTLTNNYSPREILLDNAGTGLGITTDIQNAARSTTTPDVGAYEFTGSITVPVKLVSIFADKIRNDVALNWSVAFELNSSRYEIERSTDAVRFSYAGTVPSKNSSTGASYTFTDVNAVIQTVGQVIYYRLRMVDIDGTVEYSPVVAVRIDKNLVNAVAAYGNPFANEAIIKLTTGISQKVRIALADVLGKQLPAEIFTVRAGTNLVSLKNSRNLLPGIYIATVEMGGELFSVKIVKQ